MNPVLEQALAGEFAVMFAYGRAGARLTTGQDRARAALEDHRVSRDQLREWILDAGGTPSPPQAGYLLPRPVTGERSARRALAEVELRLLPVYAAMTAATDLPAEQRTWAAIRTQDCAVRAVQWGARPQAFPWPDAVSPSG